MRYSILAFCLSFATPVWAQDGFDFGSSPNPVGSGARALGIGSAFIATADDATASSWNPGGLIALERAETSMVLSLKNRNEFFDGIGVRRRDAVQQATYADLNYFSVAVPFKIGRRFFVASLNYQSLIDFDKTIRKTYFAAGSSLRSESDILYREKGSLKALAPSLAFQLSPQIALGFTLTLWTDKLGYPNSWRQRQVVSRTVATPDLIDDQSFIRNEEFSFNGAGMNAGMLWDIDSHWTLGAVLKTPVWGAVKHTLRRFDRDGAPVYESNPSYKESFNLPPSYGVGAAYRHTDALTISGDLYRTEWSLFKHRRTDLNSGKRQSINPISGGRYKKAKVSGTVQAHLGAEYLFIFPWTVVPARAGAFYDPEPNAEGTLHFVGLAAGTGVSLGDIVIDGAYQLRRSLGAEPDVVGSDGGQGLTNNEAGGGAVWQHLLYLSAIYHL